MDIQSFIIKVWLEETSRTDGTTTWRGHITHVPSGSRHYVQTLEEIALFILLHLKHMGVRTDWRWRLLWRLNRRKRRARHATHET